MDNSIATFPTVAARPRAFYAVAGVVLLLTAVTGLCIYKWGPSLKAVQTAQSTGVLKKPTDKIMAGGPLETTLNYFRIVWPAMVFGVLIGAIVRAAVTPKWIALMLGGGGVRQTLTGGIVGAPLMLCSCCVTPIFTGVYERGARLGASLALMMGSPGLNVAAIVLTFLLMPLDLAIVRLAGSAVIVFVLSAVIGAWLEKTIPARKRPGAGCATQQPPSTPAEFGLRFLRSLAYMTLITVPLIFVGVLCSSLILPHALDLTRFGAVLAVAVAALAGTVVALPTFFEIPLAMLLLPVSPGAAAAFMIAGPIVNLPSLFVLGKETSVRIAVAVGAGVWLVATLCGLAISFA